MKAGWLAWALLAAASCVGAEPKCPPGTRAVTETNPEDQVRTEWCEDLITGRQHGPWREYARDGALLVASELHQGEILSRRLTKRGIQRAFTEINAEVNAEKPGQFWINLSLVDERTIRVDMTLNGIRSSDVTRGFRASVGEGGPICEWLMLDGANFQTLKLVAVDEVHRPLATETFSRADCMEPAK